MSTSQYAFADDVESQSPSSSSSSSSSSSWETPFTSSSIEEKRKEQKSRIPSQLFHGLATLLIVSLCILLVELQSPGIASKVSKRLHTYWAWVPDKESTDMRTSSVPAPFVYSHDSKYVAFVPTSEPTIVSDLEHSFVAPTSEPTEFRDRMGRFMVNGPTSEPTEYRESEPGELPPPPAGTIPTSEPTIFDRDALEDGAQPTNEPTVFAGTPETNDAPPPAEEPEAPDNDTASQPISPAVANTPTSEPTVFTEHIKQPPTSSGTVHSPTSEPTMIGEVRPYQPAEPSPTSEPTTIGEENPYQPAEPTEIPLNTFSPTSKDFVSYAPTSDPTTFPTPTPTNLA